MKTLELEQFIKDLYEGRKYGHKDSFGYHLVGVAELAREKAREAMLDPDLAYALGLCHDFIEDFPDKMGSFPELCEMACPNKEHFQNIFAMALFELTNPNKDGYYDYIKRIRMPYALLLKEADLEFNLLQDNAPKLRKYDLYRFALDMIRMKRIVGR